VLREGDRLHDARQGEFKFLDSFFLSLESNSCWFASSLASLAVKNARGTKKGNFWSSLLSTFFFSSKKMRPSEKEKTQNQNPRQGTRKKKLFQDAGEPFFVWFNSTHMHFRTHAKPEELGQAGRWQSPYHDVMVSHSRLVGKLLKFLDDSGLVDDTVSLFFLSSTSEPRHFLRLSRPLLPLLLRSHFSLSLSLSLSRARARSSHRKQQTKQTHENERKKTKIIKNPPQNSSSNTRPTTALT
jgi:hypothetical protein